MSEKPACVLGAGSWGTVLASLLASEGRPVRLVARDPAKAARLQAERENPEYLPGLELPPSVQVGTDYVAGLKDAELLVVAVPSRAVASVVRAAGATELVPSRVVSASKGFEPETLATMTEVLARELGEARTYAALSGPNLAREVAAGKPAAAVLACTDPVAAGDLQRAFTCGHFRAYTSKDVLGVELGGALKNVLAIASGILSALDYGTNAQASLMTRGLAEITRLSVAMGADPMTFLGLAGVGDMLATCTSELSRNFRCGRMVAEGIAPSEVQARLGQAVEGLSAVEAACQLGQRHGIDMPIASQLSEVLYQGKPAAQAARDLMGRPLKSERSSL